MGDLNISDIENLLDRKLKPISKDVSELKKGQRKLIREVSLITRYFDREFLDHDKRIERLEELSKLS